MADLSLRAQCVPSNPLALPYPLSRRAIEDHIETLISVLDALDGETDLEDDDPAGGSVDDEGEESLGIWAKPIYGADQRRAARNIPAIEAEHLRRENTRSERAYRELLARHGWVAA